MTFVQSSCYLNPAVSALHNIAYKYKTDKCWIQPNGLSYLVHYETHMHSKKFDEICFLEIGVRDGSSLMTWNEYFVNNKLILGIDIDDNCKSQYYEENIKVIIGDATKVLNYKHLNNKFDYVLDDGSHRVPEIIKSFELYYPLLTEDGIYIVEDMDTVERQSKKNEFSLLKDFIGEFEHIEYHATTIIRK